MGDIVDATQRFNAARYVQWWDAFCSGQMNTTSLLDHMRQDEAFKLFCARKLAETRKRQLEAEDSA